MDHIKFGTDGWRGIIARDFTLANVARFAHGLARWLTGKFQQPSAVIGYDTRFGGEMFMEAVAKVLASKNIRVFISENFVSTPMVSLGVVKLKASCGIMITASHQPAEYNGIKLKSDYGGPMPEKDTRDIENLISSEYEFDLEMLNWNYLLERGLIQYINLEAVYTKNLRDQFNIDLIRESKLRFAFDAMHGGALHVFRKLLPEVSLIRCSENPSFGGIPPEPLQKNLHPLEEFLSGAKNIDCALAVDGDGDRIALFDDQGNYIDSHHIFLLLVHYLAGYRKLGGKVVAGISGTGRLEQLCRHYGLESERVPVGFRQISELMNREKILAAGEESGGMTTGDYLPERDGVWIGLMVWQWLAESGKKLSELLAEIEKIVGSFAYERMDMELNRNLRNKIIDSCRNNAFRNFGPYQIRNTDTLDGFRYELDDESWVMIRASGTEPVIRIYAEGPDRAVVSEILNAVKITLGAV